MTVPAAPRKVGDKFKGIKAVQPTRGTVTRAHEALNRVKSKQNSAADAPMDHTRLGHGNSPPRSSRLSKQSRSPGKRSSGEGGRRVGDEEPEVADHGEAATTEEGTEDMSRESGFTSQALASTWTSAAWRGWPSSSATARRSSAGSTPRRGAGALGPSFFSFWRSMALSTMET
jgi:hypothetical protein